MAGSAPVRPYLVREQLQLSGAGAESAAASTSRPLRAAQPGDRRRSRSMRCARDGPARRCRRRGWLRHRRSPALVAAATAAPHSWLQFAAPPPPPGAPARRANQAWLRPSRHRPAGPVAPRPKFSAGGAGGSDSRRRGPRHWFPLASRDLRVLKRTPAKRRVKLREKNPRK